MNQTIFNPLLQPLEAVIALISPIIDQESPSQKLFFADFLKKMLFAYLEQVSSLRNLPIELAINAECRGLGLSATPFSTLKDEFSRFESKYFKQVFETVLGQANLKRVKSLDELGLF